MLRHPSAISVLEHLCLQESIVQLSRMEQRPVFVPMFAQDGWMLPGNTSTSTSLRELSLPRMSPIQTTLPLLLEWIILAKLRIAYSWT